MLKFANNLVKKCISQGLLFVNTCFLRSILIFLHQNKKKVGLGGYLLNYLGIKG